MVAITLLLSTLQQKPLLFVDEGTKDKSFQTFRSSLLAALEKSNRDWIDSRIDSKIRYSFGANEGKKGMVEDWRNRPEGIDGFYTELAAVVKQGGGFRAGSFWAPYVYAFWPEDIDPFEHGAIIGDKIPVYNNTIGEQRMVGTLSWEIVKLLPDEHPVPENKGWQLVEYHGRPAWVKSDKVHSSVGYRACFTKVKGSWMLTAFIAGD